MDYLIYEIDQQKKAIIIFINYNTISYFFLELEYLF